MPTQTQIGKAFEYALISEANNILTARGFTVNMIMDANYTTCLACFGVFTAKQQTRYLQAAIEAINHIITLEPRLVNPLNARDILTLQLQPDAAGQAGDVRDILFIRSAQPWTIGISAKNNHKALKHSRLSNIKDFGASWVGVPCSRTYFLAIAPTFATLTALKATGATWNTQANKHTTYYQPILNAFRNEVTERTIHPILLLRYEEFCRTMILENEDADLGLLFQAAQINFRMLRDFPQMDIPHVSFG